ncbi:hypothetical protein L6452_13620 [Arctium lappa]|uniref:Uncharacterized protein n=1 Tax=Arctium lappa TaxID=4217 RepID=A0ACB9CJ44_ARCLA|nr:hypothetical protein L6452_13620 [Arctium lappa]
MTSVLGATLHASGTTQWLAREHCALIKEQISPKPYFSSHSLLLKCSQPQPRISFLEVDVCGSDAFNKKAQVWEPYTELSLAVVPMVLDGSEWRVELGRSSDRMALMTSSGLVKIADLVVLVTPD